MLETTFDQGRKDINCSTIWSNISTP